MLPRLPVYFSCQERKMFLKRRAALLRIHARWRHLIDYRPYGSRFSRLNYPNTSRSIWGTFHDSIITPVSPSPFTRVVRASHWEAEVVMTTCWQILATTNPQSALC